jgi:hypothetical protein
MLWYITEWGEKKNKSSVIWDSHAGEYKDGCILQQAPLKTRPVFKTSHGDTISMTAIFMTQHDKKAGVRKEFVMKYFNVLWRHSPYETEANHKKQQSG